MQRLSYKVIEKLIGARVTSAEVSLLIYMSRYQDYGGTVRGVYYKEACAAVGITYPTFYEALRGLRDKGLIDYVKDSYTDYDVKIIDNDFSAFAEEDYQSGEVKYVSTAHTVFADPRFHAFRSREKLLVLELMKITGAKNGSYIIGTKNFYSKYEKLLGVTARVLRSYLHTLKTFFSIGIKDFKYFFTQLKATHKKTGGSSERRQLYIHYITALIRREKLTADKDKIADMADTMSQYSTEIASAYNGKEDKIFNIFTRAVMRSIELANDLTKPRSRWNRNINVKFVHKQFVNLINA